MQKSAAQPRPGPDPVFTALAAIAAITLYRIVLLGFSDADLFVDEAQYWQWGQELDWGYYSKPPLIGWIIRAVTDLAGSDTAFWIRLPGPLFHAAIALILIWSALRVTDRAAAAMVGLAYVTMPAVALGSLLFSTDTILLPFFAAATGIWLGLTQRASVPAAVAMGLCLGLGMMGKYAAIYFPLCAALGALFVPPARIGWRDAGVAALVAGIVFAPNVIWNLQNDLTTLSHTADNVNWVRKPGLSLNFAGAAEFLAAQLAVMGPLLFPAFVVIAVRSLRAQDWRRRWLVWMSVPILLMVTLQALLSRAYANWAVTALVASLLLTIPVLWHRARWVLWLGLAVNLGLAVALPFAATKTTTWTMGDRLVLARYTGRTALSNDLIAVARSQGLNVVVSDHRDILADLFHTARGSGLTVFAAPIQGRAPHFYAQTHPFPEIYNGTALFVSFAEAAPCESAVLLKAQPAGPGAYAGRTVRIYRVPGNCWQSG